MVLVYTDREADCELVSDGYMMQAPFGEEKWMSVAFEVPGKMITVGEEDFGISANVDEDEEAGATMEGGENTSEKKCDIEHHFKYQRSGFNAKNFKQSLSAYIKNVLMPLVSDEEKDEFKSAIQSLFVKMNEEFENAEVFYGETAFEIDDPSRAMPIYAYWHGDEPAPRFIYLRKGLKEAKY